MNLVMLLEVAAETFPDRVGVNSSGYSLTYAELQRRARVAALIRASGCLTELPDWVKARLRSSRVPVAIHFHQELPYNETGKLLRRVVRQEFMQENT